ncbi:MAG: hypothetical protein V4513_08340 [Pseudomonadota bacterium]
MKSIRYAAIAALLTTSFTPISLITAPAAAAVPTLTDMQTVCASYDTDGAGTNIRVLTTAGNTDLGTPTGDESTIANIETTRKGNPSSLQTPAGTRSFYSAPGRHGGSVNLFATVGWSAKLYAGSLVDQSIQRFQTDTYNFTCDVEEWQVVGNHEVVVPGTPAQGYYTNSGTAPSNGGGSCQGLSPSNPHWGTDIGNCEWHQTAAGTEATSTFVDDYGYVNIASNAETLVNGPYYVDTVTYATDVPQAVSFLETTSAPYFQGDVVVCNNPGSKGGTWRAQNGWTDMTKCTTAYFNTASWISGANVFSSNSLPTL